MRYTTKTDMQIEEEAMFDGHCGEVTGHIFLTGRGGEPRTRMHPGAAPEAEMTGCRVLFTKMQDTGHETIETPWVSVTDVGALEAMVGPKVWGRLEENALEDILDRIEGEYDAYCDAYCDAMMDH